VKKVHVEVRRFAAAGYCVILIGHAGHEEVVGTAGEAPGVVVLVETLEQARIVAVPNPELLAYVTQATLSIDETKDIVAALRERFPKIIGPRKDDICYATTNRQLAVKELLAEIDLLLVIGSSNSSNSNRLVETARTADVSAYLIEDEHEIDEAWLEGLKTAGLTSRASVPESLLTRVCDWFRLRGVTDIAPFAVRSEGVSFKLPVELSRAAADTPA
jgi:4-hydroxy-3-methylbut-2-enyl diphosphate reductase